MNGGFGLRPGHGGPVAGNQRGPYGRRMEFQRPLIPARLERRYKRFLADVTLEDGSTVTAHCANPGSMLGLDMPGSRVWLEPNDNPKRKLRYSWKIIELSDGTCVGIDTTLPNRLLSRALRNRELAELADYATVRAEVNYGQSSRVDFLLTEPGLPDAFVEIKNVHLCREPGWAEFPDSVTARGTRHLRELAAVARDHRAVMIFLVQRMDCHRFRLATDIDPVYAAAFDSARDAGVDMLCYGTVVSPHAITLGPRIPIDTAWQDRC